jgi:NADH dehydrogenase/NADH:ubiquinone oxidoreductase subunit G
MDMITLKINGMPLSVPKGTTVLEAAQGQYRHTYSLLS